MISNNFRQSKSYKTNEINLNFKYRLHSMSLDQQNLLTLKKCKRLIVQKAYILSDANIKYSFPRRSTQQQSQSDSCGQISLKSQVSQLYDLHQQNIHTKNQRQQRKILPLNKLFKNKLVQNQQKNKEIETQTTFFSFKHILSQNGKCSKKYLSLTPSRKCHQYRLDSKSLNKSKGIVLTKQNIFSSLQNIKSQNFFDISFQGLKRIASRCFDMDFIQSRKDKKNEALFFDTKIEFYKEASLQKIKSPLKCQVTADSTPQISTKDLKTRNKILLSKQSSPMYENMIVSSFEYK